MKILVLLLVIFFVVANVLTEYLRRKTDNAVTEPMSDYLTGPYGRIQDYGFFALSAALLILAVGGLQLVAWSVPLFCGSAALVGVVETKRLMLTHAASRPWLERVHVACAGIAFAAVTFAELYLSRGHQLLFLIPLAAVCIAALFSLFKLTQTAMLEKTYAALIVLWLIVWVLA
ncbi:MAG: hypothetical protein KGL39_28505 [Patescibacteria group bacterium]|nr:hypothetical protein [Patescibacteria group bacterium]